MNVGIISLISIIIALCLMMFFAVKGLSLLVIGPLVSALVLFMSGMNVMDGLTGAYSSSLGNFVISNFLLFLSASLFGHILGECSAAEDIAYGLTKQIDKIKVGNKKFWTLLILTAVFAILTYGGVSAFVIVFTMVPLTKRIFKKYDIPWQYYMVVHSLGANNFTASSLPGTPSVQNLIPIDYFGTTPMAAPKMGIITSIFSLVLGLIYMRYCLNKSEKRQEGFLPTGELINETILEEDSKNEANREHGSFLKAILSPVVVLVFMNIVNLPASASLTLGIVACIILYYKNFDNLYKTLGDGTMNGVKTLVTVAAIVGFGGVITSVPAYDMIVSGIDKIPGSPLIQFVLAVNIVAGMTGSASGGESIALEAFGSKFVSMGFDPAGLHRIVAIACHGFDSVPWGGSIVNQLNVAKLTHKQGYKHVFVVSALIPFVTALFAVFLYHLGII